MCALYVDRGLTEKYGRDAISSIGVDTPASTMFDVSVVAHANCRGPREPN